MDKTKIRGTDLICGSLFLLLGIYILVAAFQMPLRGSFAGVINVWYVSPALFPIIIGIGMILLAIGILRHALKEGGIQQLKQIIEERKKTPILNEKSIRFASILLPLLTMVYVNLTRMDFFFAVALFLSFTIPVFYYNSLPIMKKMLLLYSCAMALIFILAITQLDRIIKPHFFYFMDSIALILLVVLNVSTFRLVKKNAPEQRKKLRQLFLISYFTPILLTVMFRFFLRVPLPYEGAMTDIMIEIQFLLRHLRG